MHVRSKLDEWRDHVLAVQLAGLLRPLRESPKCITGRYFATMHEAVIDLAGETIATLRAPDPDVGVPIDFEPDVFLPIACRVRAAIENNIEMWLYREHQQACMRAPLIRPAPSDRSQDRDPQHPVPHEECTDTRTCPIRRKGERAVSVLKADGTWRDFQLTATAVAVLCALAEHYPEGRTRQQLVDVVPSTDPIRPLNAAWNEFPELRAVLRRPEVARRGSDLKKDKRVYSPGLYILVSPLQPAEA
jgi:hypothetical protein